MMNQSTRWLVIFAGVFFVLLPGRALAIVPPLLDASPTLDVSKLKLKPIVLPTPKAKNLEEFCSNFTATADKLATNLSSKSDKVNEFIKEEGNTLEEKRNARDAKLEGARSKADERRSEWYGRLEAKATTDAEKDAVVKFKQTVEKAVEARRDAVDEAIDEFRKGVDAAVASRKTSMESTRDAFQKSVEAAAAQVSTDCTNGETTTAIKKKFKDSLKAARDKLKSDHSDMEKVRGIVKTLAETRRTAMKEAFADFDTAVEKAKTDLKAAFNE